MGKRLFLQKAHPLNLKKHTVAGALASEKYDGYRAFWDGGVSRGVLASEVPWANTAKDSRYVSRPVATGLWSFYGNTIQAPDWFLDSLPPFMLDCELYAGRGRFQFVTSVASKIVPTEEWRALRLMVLDTPPPAVVLADGFIDLKPNYVKILKGCVEWVRSRDPGLFERVPSTRYGSFITAYRWLENNLPQNDVVQLALQEQLPFSTPKALERLDEKMNEIVDGGGEGVILRKQTGIWAPERVHECTKYKPYDDAEGTVTNFIWGRETDRGSKLLGLMGALVLEFQGKRLELSGFTNEERKLRLAGPGDPEEGVKNPGNEVTSAWEHPLFPRGSKVSFKYRELTDAGVPKEARFWRKRTEL